MNVLELVIWMAAIGLVDVLAAALGTDSRDGNDWVQNEVIREETL
jgi:hypothetical protein